MLRCGDTFLLPKSAYAVEHLWIVITDPEPETNKAVCVNITSRSGYSEAAVLVQPSEHPFVKHESVINYRDACELDLGKVFQVLTTKTPQRFAFGIYDPCSPELLRRIQDGLLSSPHVSKRIKEYCSRKWQVPPATRI